MDKEKLVEQYFSGQISERAFLQLKTLLEEDSAFKEEFYSQLEIQQTIAQEKHALLKERLNQLDRKPIRKINWYLYVAAAVILVAIGFLFYRPEPNFARLYTANFEAYPNVVAPTVRRSEDSEEDKTAAAFSYYDNQQFEDAAIAFEKLYQKGGEDYALFYRSVSLMAMGDTELSIEELENHVWSDPGTYQTIADWYVGLGYLKLQNREKAIVYLKRAANSADPVAKKATNLLQKLK